MKRAKTTNHSPATDAEGSHPASDTFPSHIVSVEELTVEAEEAGYGWPSREQHGPTGSEADRRPKQPEGKGAVDATKIMKALDSLQAFVANDERVAHIVLAHLPRVLRQDADKYSKNKKVEHDKYIWSIIEQMEAEGNNNTDKLTSIFSMLDDMQASMEEDPDLARGIRGHPIFGQLMSGKFAEAAQAHAKNKSEATPSRPRAKWSDETKKSKAEGRRNPAQFIRDEFAEELTAGTLTRPQLKNKDSVALYDAYGAWIARHPKDAIWGEVSRKQERVNLERLSPAEALSRKRALTAASVKRHRSRFCQ